MLRNKTTPLIAAAALAVSACGGDDGDDKVSASDYANDVCTAFQEFGEAVQSGQGELDSSLTANSSPQEGKDALATFFDAAVDASDQLVQDIEDAGTPDVENGEEAADAMQQIADEANSQFEDARQEVDQLPTDSPQSFARAARELRSDMQAATEDIGQGVREVDSPDLEEAFEEESACQ